MVRPGLKRLSKLSLGRLKAARPPHLTRCRALASDAGEELRRTPLWSLHKELGATMTGFGGWDMPLKYPGKDGGIMGSHHHCRNAAGLFDVSHMVPVKVHGKDRAAFMETFLVGNILELPEHMGTLSSIPNDEAGLLDDCICTNAVDHMYLVINAGHEDKDLPHIRAKMDSFVAAGGEVSMEVTVGDGLLALQGPKAATVLQRLSPEFDIGTMPFMSGYDMAVGGYECFVTRSGYTGEDGFEIKVPGEHAEALARTLLAQEEVLPVGLGARDSLRLEAGLCLYGNDLDDTTNLAEGVLMWTVGKRRREEGGFPGHDILMRQFTEKSAVRKRVGFACETPDGGKRAAPVREGSAIFDAEGEQVGVVTSGVQSPCLGKPIGMAYVASKYQKAGNELFADVRGKKQKLTVTKMPFVPANYYRGA